MNFVFAPGDMGWMAGLIAVGVVYGIFAFVYGRGKS